MWHSHLQGNIVTSENRFSLWFVKLWTGLQQCRENLALIYFRWKKEIIKKTPWGPKNQSCGGNPTPTYNGCKF